VIDKEDSPRVKALEAELAAMRKAFALSSSSSSSSSVVSSPSLSPQLPAPGAMSVSIPLAGFAGPGSMTMVVPPLPYASNDGPGAGGYGAVIAASMQLAMHGSMNQRIAVLFPGYGGGGGPR